MKITTQNLMKIIDVEEGQEFSIEGRRYKFDDGRLMVFGEVIQGWRLSGIELNYLLSREIILPPWRPKPGEIYYTPMLHITQKYLSNHWADDKSDRIRDERGLICRTAEEAIEKADKMLEVLK